MSLGECLPGSLGRAGSLSRSSRAGTPSVAVGACTWRRHPTKSFSYTQPCDYPPVLSPAGVGGPIPIPAPAQMGGLLQPWGPNSMVTQETGRFWDFWENRQTKQFWASETTREQDSVPKGPKICSYGPFLSHLVRISSQIKPNPTRPTWGNLAMDFGFFFNWGTWILKVPKRPRKRHNWIAELASFKMR